VFHVVAEEPEHFGMEEEKRGNADVDGHAGRGGEGVESPAGGGLSVRRRPRTGQRARRSVLVGRYSQSLTRGRPRLRGRCAWWPLVYKIRR